MPAIRLQPTPWRASRIGTTGLVPEVFIAEVLDANNIRICQTDELHAKHIVDCVNAHAVEQEASENAFSRSPSPSGCS